MMLRAIFLHIGILLSFGSFAQSQVVINEIMYDPEGADDEFGEWVELYNPGETDIDIEGWVIHCHGGFVHTIENGAPLLVPAGGYLLVGRSMDTGLNGNVNVAYAYGNDIPLGGGDAFWLVNGSYPSVDSVNFGGVGFPTGNGVSLELFNPTMPNNTASSWSTSRSQWAGADFGTPGEQNSIYSSVRPGDVVITEIMSNTLAVGDIFGEWFEVYNRSENDVDLNGVTFYDLSVDSFTVAGALVIPPGEFAVFTVNADSATNGGLVHERLYDWGSNTNFRFSVGDAVIMRSGILRIDSVRFDGATGWPEPEGASMVLTNLTVDNNLPEYWTVATLREPGYSGMSGDLGSPGTLGHDQSLVDITPPFLEFARSFNPKLIEVFFSEPLDKATAENPANYQLDGDIGQGLDPRLSDTDPTMVRLSPGEPILPFVTYNLTVVGIADTLGNAMSSTGTQFAFSPPALPFDVSVTEIMHDPSGVQDDQGEWFEVFNRSTRDIEMSGWTISDLTGQSFTVTGSVMVPAQSYAVFTVNSDSATNGGMVVATDSCGCPCTMLYDWGTAIDFSLTGQDAIIIRNGDVTIDSVSWGGLGWPNPGGASLVLKNFPPTWTHNDADNWFTATVREPGYNGPGENLGSPGTTGTGQFPNGELTFTVTIPAANLVVPAAGDTFDVRLQWIHNTNMNVFVDSYTELITPEGVHIPLLGPFRIMVPANSVLNRWPRVSIAASYPAGIYTVNAVLSSDGMFPADTIRFASGTFQKVASANLTTGLESNEDGLPAQTYLSQNYPNPFNPSTEIRYGLREDAWTTLKVYNSLGQEVITLVNELQAAGHRSVTWNGKNGARAQVATGIYIYRLTAGQFVETRKFILMK